MLTPTVAAVALAARPESTAELARRLGVPRQTLSAIRGGRKVPAPELRRRIARAFAIPVGDWSRRPVRHGAPRKRATPEPPVAAGAPDVVEHFGTLLAKITAALEHDDLLPGELVKLSEESRSIVRARDAAARAAAAPTTQTAESTHDVVRAAIEHSQRAIVALVKILEQPEHRAAEHAMREALAGLHPTIAVHDPGLRALAAELDRVELLDDEAQVDALARFYVTHRAATRARAKRAT